MPATRSVAHLAAKRVIDLAGATCGLALCSGVLLVAGLAVRTTMGAPVFFRQTRPGKDGRPFRLVKFRTMRQPRPGEDPLRTDGSRLTQAGAFLRSTSIDELPTLWNVLKGDMSLVGPRPLLMEYLPRYTREQARRHEVKPGITGWAQINGRNAISWEKKFELDVWYVDHWSPWLDLKILGMTAYKVLRRDGVSHPGEATMSEFRGSNCDGDGHA